MPITYIKIRPFFDMYFEDHVPDTAVLLFDPVVERSSDTIGDRFRRIDASIRGNADIIVFRGSTTDFFAQVCEDVIIKSVVGETPAYVLCPEAGLAPGCPDGVLHMGLIKLPWSSQAESPLPSLEALREVELLAILERGEAIFNGHNDHHFVLPAGYHAPEFIRLTNALRDPFEVARLADWVMPFIRKATVVLADTGTLSALLFALQAKAFAYYGWMLSIEALDGYPGDLTAMSRAMADAAGRLGVEVPDLLLIVSVSSSGRLVRLFRSLASVQSTVLVICDSTGGQTPQAADPGTAVFARYPIVRWIVDESGQCSECTRLQKTDIHPRTYERVENRECELVSLNWREADRHKAFWESADSVDAVHLHVDAQYHDGRTAHSRHFGIYVDIPRLLTNPAFRATCLSELRAMSVPDRVLVPTHIASVAVAGLVQEAFATNGILFPLERIHFVGIGRLRPNIVESISDCSRVLIADDALVGGSTLIGLRAEIYRATQVNNIRPVVDAFVVVARSHDHATLNAVRRRFRDPRTGGDVNLHFGEQIFLPRGTNADHGCPLCYEAQLLGQYLPKLSGAGREFAIARLEELRGSTRRPRLPADRVDVDGELLVTHESYFGEAHRPAAYASAAAAAQEVRAGIDVHKRGQPRKIIDVRMLIDSYFESILVGAILRTFPVRLLRWGGQEEQVSEAVRALGTEQAYPGTVFELGWAAVSGKLPPRAVLDLLARVSEPDPPIIMLRQILSLQLGL
jgi:hypothetical protein